MHMACAAAAPPVRRTSLVGELDLASAARVTDHLAQVVHPGSRVLVDLRESELDGQQAEDRLDEAGITVDLSDVRFMDCAGLGPLVQAHRRAAAGGGWVRLHRVPAGPLRVLVLTDTAWLVAPGG